MKYILPNTRYRKAFYLALSLLTRLPVTALDNIQAKDSGRSALFYPLIGLIIGVLLFLPALLFPATSPLLLAAIIITAWASTTGGLHLDGLADSADAWLGGVDDEEKTYRVMKDPLVGAAGVIAIVCVLLLKVSALTVVIQAGWSGLIILAPIVGRNAILLLFISTQYMRSQGIASEVLEYLPRTAVKWVVGVCLLVGALFSIWGMLCALTGFWLLRRMMLKRLGGFTGDTVGASVEITEMLFLVGSALATS